MNQLVASIVPLSLGAMVSPTVLTAVVLVLSGKVRPLARAWAFVGGATAILLVLTVAAPLLAHAAEHVNHLYFDGFDVALGLLLLALGVRGLLTHKRSPEQRAPKSAEPQAHLGAFAAFGVAMIGTDLSSLVLYVAALKEIARAHVVSGAKVAIVLVPFVAVLLPALVPVLISTVAPRGSQRILAPVAAWVGKYSKVLTVAISFGFGVYLLAKGIPPFFR